MKLSAAVDSKGPELSLGLHLCHPQLVLLEALSQSCHLLPLCLPLLEQVEVWLLLALALPPLLSSRLGGSNTAVSSTGMVEGSIL